MPPQHASPSSGKLVTPIAVRALRETDLSAAKAVFRSAFGIFLGLPDPSSFSADREYVSTRWRADPDAALAAEIDGALVGSNFAARWGSFGFFGPLTVRPELWRQGVATSLLASTMDLFAAWHIKEAGLFTFAHSIGHVQLYQKFDFWPRFLTLVLSKSIEDGPNAAFSKYSEMNVTERRQALVECRSLTDSLLEGLDVSLEIASVADQKLGETLLLWGDDSMEAFAVCHCGEGTEAGADTCYVKFAAARSGLKAERLFGQLLDTCETFARQRGLKRLEAGVNLHRSHAYRVLLQRGFRTLMQGVAMHKSNSPGYNRPEAYVLDDWR